MNHSKRVEQLHEIVDLIPNISEGKLRLEMNLGDTAFRAVSKAAQAEYPEIKRIKEDKQFRYKIIDNFNTVQVTLKPTQGITPNIEISQDWSLEF